MGHIGGTNLIVAERFIPFCKIPKTNVHVVGEVRFNGAPIYNQNGKIVVIEATDSSQTGEKSIALVLPTSDAIRDILRDRFHVSMTNHMHVMRMLNEPINSGYISLLDSFLVDLGVDFEELSEWEVSCGYLYTNGKYYRAYWRHPSTEHVNVTEYAERAQLFLKENSAFYLAYGNRIDAEVA